MTRFAHAPRFVAPLVAILLGGGGIVLAQTPPAPSNTPAPSTTPAPSSTPAAQATTLAIGARMPSGNVRMRATDGRSVTLAHARGAKGTLVVFTCNHCPYARAWDARLTALGNEFAGRGVGVVAINANDPATHPEDGPEASAEHARASGMRFPYVIDATSDVARAFGATKTPEAFLFDHAGKLVYHGAIDDNSNEPAAVTQHYLHDALESLVAGRPIATVETRSIGCGIKFRPARPR